MKQDENQEGDIQLGDDFDGFDETGNANTASVQHAFVVRHDVSTKVKLDRMQVVLQLARKEKKISHGNLVREALDALGEKVGYDKLEKKYWELIDYIDADYVLKK